MSAPSYFRTDGQVQTPEGLAVAGASIAVLTQPADFTSQPGSPLADIYAANASNSATITSASWNGGQITFGFSTTPPSDVVEGSYIGVSGVTPAAYNTTLEDPYLVLAVDGDDVIVASLTNPGTYVSGGTAATSVLPNPTSSDNNGNYFFYAAASIYSVQIYAPTITERDLPDQDVGATGAGTVTSVGLTMPGVLFSSSVTGSPVTTSGTLAPALVTQTANTVLAGPGSGSAATPTFRALVTDDLPAGVGSVTSVALSLVLPSFLSVVISGSPVTTTGTLTGTITLATQSANLVFAGPASGSAAAPTFRSLVGLDQPFWFAVTVLSGATDAIAFPSVNYVTKAGVDAMTLATPTAGTDDGKMIRVVDSTGNAHTITTAANKIVPSHDTVTFNGTAGSFVDMQCYNGLWYPLASSGVTFSEV
jgi:hypothetical protein